LMLTGVVADSMTRRKRRREMRVMGSCGHCEFRVKGLGFRV